MARAKPTVARIVPPPKRSAAGPPAEKNPPALTFTVPPLQIEGGVTIHVAVIHDDPRGVQGTAGLIENTRNAVAMASPPLGSLMLNVPALRL